MDRSALYDANRRRLAELVRGLSDEQLATVVPGCPEWSIRDLLGHLVGAPKDIFTGRVGDLPPNEWTQRQVTERAALPLDELLATWDDEAPQWLDKIAADERFGPILVIDSFTHEHDIRGAVGEPAAAGAEADDALDFVVQQMTGWLDQSLRAKGLPAVRLRAGESEWVLGSGDPAATVTFPSTFELARALAGRRSRSQIEGYDWEWHGERRAELVDAIPQLPMAARDQPL